MQRRRWRQEQRRTHRHRPAGPNAGGLDPHQHQPWLRHPGDRTRRSLEEEPRSARASGRPCGRTDPRRQSDPAASQCPTEPPPRKPDRLGDGAHERRGRGRLVGPARCSPALGGFKGLTTPRVRQERRHDPFPSTRRHRGLMTRLLRVCELCSTRWFLQQLRWFMQRIVCNAQAVVRGHVLRVLIDQEILFSGERP